MIDRLSGSFYSKSDDSALWGPVWAKINLSGKRALDYGCGNGGFSYLIASRGAFVEGIDLSESLVQVARQRIPHWIPQPKFSVRDAHATGLADGSFDYVFGNGILHHLELEKAYREISRVLKPGGRAFFMEPMDQHPMLALLRKVTPAARSVDEKPMTLEEIQTAERFFINVKHTEHFLFAVAAAPIHLVSDTIAFWTIKGLDLVDRGMFKLLPGLNRFAWLSMLEMEKA
ncbi:MAG: class I SAM-dependent methyltransferase [Terriglobales bacterium]